MIFLKKYKVLFIAFFAISLNTFSQEIVIKDFQDNTIIPNITVHNVNKTKSILSNLDGIVDLSFFEKSDTLIFSHVSYEKLKISINKISNSVIYLFPNTQMLSEIILSVGRNREDKKKISKKVSLITAEKTELDLPQTSAELLYHAGGIRIQKTQGGGGSPVIRGFEANRVLLVVDGVRMNNAIYRSGHLQNAITIDPNTLERTEVIFGPSSVGYGSDALGGVVHFYTRTPKINNEKSWILKGSNSYNTILNHNINNLNLEHSKEKWASFTSFSYSNFGDIIMGSKRNHGFTDWGLNKYYLDKEKVNKGNILNENSKVQKNTNYSQIDFLQKFNIKTSESSNIIFNIQHSKSSDIDRYDKLNEFDESKENLKYSEWYYGPQKRTLLSSTYNFVNNKKWLQKGTVVAAFQKIIETRHNRKLQSLVLNSQLENLDVLSVNADFVGAKTKNSTLSYGFEYTYNNVNSKAFGETLIENNQTVNSPKNINTVFKIPTRYPSAGSNYSTAASYFEFRKDLSEKSNFNFGMRYTRTVLNASWEEEALIDANLSFVKTKNSSLTGSLGYVTRLKNNWQLNANFSSGFRSPNIDDMGKIRENRGILSVPNKKLKPEYAYSSELGVSKFFNNKSNVFSVNIYYTHITNHILRDYFEILNDKSTADSKTILYNLEEVKTMANINSGRAYIYGFSFDSELAIFRNIFIKSNITYTEGGSVKNPNPLPSISPLFGSFYLKLVNSNIKMQLSYRFSGSKSPEDYSLGGEDGLEETPLLGYNDQVPQYYGMPSWGVFKLSSSYKLSPNLKATLILDNLFDIHYREFASGISSPGRNLNLVLEHKF